LLFTIILWFTWLSNPANFTIVGIINTAVVWIVIALIINLVALLTDFLRIKFFEYLPKPSTTKTTTTTETTTTTKKK
jgi:hypothetical protein